MLSDLMKAGVRLAAFVSSATLGLILGCGRLAAQPAPAGQPFSSPDLTLSVHSIELPHLEPELPLAPGRDAFMAVCIGCHSPRYVFMQPPFPRRQWEESVDKMAKTYGAQMDSDQRSAIIGYLVAVHGPETAARPSASDEDSVAPVPATPLPSSPAPWLQPSADPQARAAESRRGAALFNQACTGCHGEAGRGDGVVAAVLRRRPKDLTATRFSTKLLSQVLWNGKPGTAMPSWRAFGEAERTALAAYVQDLQRPVPSGPVSAQEIARGREVFLVNCAPCHGEAGDGQGMVAANLLPAPANFKLKQPHTDYLLHVVKEGIPGTAMPSWKELISETDQKALAAFIRSLYEEVEQR
ncbi:MAG: c-type cytochrome [Verrucomicrobiota bacterium]